MLVRAFVCSCCRCLGYLRGQLPAWLRLAATDANAIFVLVLALAEYALVQYLLNIPQQRFRLQLFIDRPSFFPLPVLVILSSVGFDLLLVLANAI